MATIYQVTTYERFQELLDYLYAKECFWKDRVDKTRIDDIWDDYKSKLGLYVDELGRIEYGLFREMVDDRLIENIVKSSVSEEELRKEDDKELKKDFIATLQNLADKIRTIEELCFSDASQETWAEHLEEVYEYVKHAKELIEEYDEHLAFVLANDE